MIRAGLFIILTVLLAFFTLSRPHPHRFPRFFAFESLMGLVLVNAPDWFTKPYSPSHLASWFFLACSLLLAIHGFWLLRVIGAPDRDFEDTTRLVTVGAYRYIRHPLYCSLLVGGIGAFLKRPTWFGLCLFGVSAVFIYVTARVEESENVKRFGEAYREYMRHTRMFLPYIV